MFNYLLRVLKNLKSETFCYTFKVSEPEISIQTKKKFLHSKLSKKDSEIKISDTFKTKDFEVFDKISFGNRGYSSPL